MIPNKSAITSKLAAKCIVSYLDKACYPLHVSYMDKSTNKKYYLEVDNQKG